MAGRRAEPQATAAGLQAMESDGRVATFHSQDGFALAVRLFDTADSRRLPLLCLPGLSRNSRDFSALGRFFSRHALAPRRVIAVDYRGRGLSERDPDWRNYTPLVEAQDVIAAATTFGIERAVVVGTSRGGIIAMLLGALRPALIAGAVLNVIGPVIEGRGLARIKGYLSVKERSVPTWEDAAAAVRAAGQAQYPSLADDGWRALAAAYYGETRNGLAPQFDRNLAKAIVDLDLSEKIPVLWPQFLSLARVPVLAIRGALSDVLSARTLAEMQKRHPRLEALTVTGQGHAPLLNDAETLERIRALAERCDSSGSTRPREAKPASMHSPDGGP